MNAVIVENAKELQKELANFAKNGYAPFNFEPKQDIGTYSAISTGKVRLQPFGTGTPQQGLLMLLIATSTVQGVGEVQIPVNQKQATDLPKDATVGYEVFKKDAESPKRIKFTKSELVAKPITSKKATK